MRVAVVGAGVFGLAAADALLRRGHEPVVLEAGPLPNPGASSQDTSKAVRADYGADRFYAELALEAIDGWHAWNERFGERLYHECGFLFLTGAPMSPGGFEHESFALLSSMGVPLERLDPAAVRARYPAWAAARFADGYLDPRGGWVASGRVVAALARELRAAGVAVEGGSPCLGFELRGGKLAGVRTARGIVACEHAVVAAGTWTPRLLPELADRLASIAQAVVWFEAPGEEWRGAAFPVCGADIARTGFYAFPATGEHGVKVGHHGAGFARDPSASRELPPGELARFRAFVDAYLPGLAGAAVERAHLCFYCDSFDGDLWIARHPGRPGITVAAGGSGHGFKFAPLLGELVADVVEERPNPRAERFAWRALGARSREAARCGGAG